MPVGTSLPTSRGHLLATSPIPECGAKFMMKAFRFLENMANIRVPVIAAIEGRAHVHSDYALLASVIVAAEGATFQDVAHFSAGVAPGDGIFTRRQGSAMNATKARSLESYGDFASTNHLFDLQLQTMIRYPNSPPAVTTPNAKLLVRLACSRVSIAGFRPCSSLNVPLKFPREIGSPCLTKNAGTTAEIEHDPRTTKIRGLMASQSLPNANY
jgi:hypothetical protein